LIGRQKVDGSRWIRGRIYRKFSIPSDIPGLARSRAGYSTLTNTAKAPRRVPDPLPVAKPALGEAEAAAARRAILSGWVTQGPEVEAFEREFAAYVGAPHACAVSSCTTALHVALVALGVGPGDEVVTASHSFIATANAIRYVDAVPVFADVELASGNLDPDQVEAAIGPRTRAILAVHQVGMPADLGRLLALADRHGLPVVEDAACAVGSEIEWQGTWQRIGRPHGRIACFSFHPRKLLTTGDGGMLTTVDPALDTAFRRLRQHGMTVSDRERHAAGGAVQESYDRVGFNYRLTDIQAAVGREQLKRLPEMVARRRAQVALYRARLAAASAIELPGEPNWGRTNWQSFIVMLPSQSMRDRVMATLQAAGIATRPGVMTAHREPAYRQAPWRCIDGPGDRCGCAPGRCARLAASEARRDRGLILPLFDAMTEADIVRVADALIDAVA
jgi:dTDP-4-amino-4,6-dideoxygalactose transaminase